MNYYELYANLEDAKQYKNVLACVVVFSKQTIVEWCGDIRSTVVHQSLENFMKISVSGDRVLVHELQNTVARALATLHEHGVEAIATLDDN